MLSRKGSLLLRTPFENNAKYVRKVKHKRGNSDQNGTGLLNDKFFRNSKEDVHYSHGTRAQRSLKERRNTKVWELKREGFHDTIIRNSNKLPPRNLEVKKNVERYQNESTRSYLFKDSPHRFNEIPNTVSDRLINLVKSRLDPSNKKTDSEIRKSLLDSNLEISIAVYLLQGKPSLIATKCDYGVTTIEYIDGIGAVVIQLSCESLSMMIDKRFLDVAHQVSSSVSEVDLFKPFTDPKSILLTSNVNIDGNTLPLEDFLLKKSLSLNEAITIKRVTVAPHPINGFMGWYVHNPRDDTNKLGDSICCVSVMVDEIEWSLLESEWKDKAQSYIGHVLAQHCCLEPLRVGDTGRLLKQSLQAPLDYDESFRFSSGSPTVFDWLDDCSQRLRIPITRFGVVKSHQTIGVSKIWVSFLAEDHRYGNFSRHNDPQPVEEKFIKGDFSKENSHNKKIKNDLEVQEMWHNEPGQKSFSELTSQSEDVKDDGFESDEELLNSKQF